MEDWSAAIACFGREKVDSLMLRLGRGEAVRCQGRCVVNCACLCDTVLHMCDRAKVPAVDGVKESARASRLEIEFQPLHPIAVSEVRVPWSWH